MSCGRRDTLQCLYHRTTMSVHYNVGDQQETIPLTCNCQGCSGSQICSCSCLMIMRRMQPIFQWCPRNLSIATRCSFLHELSVCGNRWFNPEVIWELTGEGHEFVHCTHPWIPNFSLDCFSLSALLTDANWAYCLSWYIYFCFCFVLFTPEGFTVTVANDGLKKARAYWNQVSPRSTALYIPSEGCSVNFRWKHLQTTPTHFFLGRAEYTPRWKNPCCYSGAGTWDPWVCSPVL